jgi:hypothetical protein
MISKTLAVLTTCTLLGSAKVSRKMDWLNVPSVPDNNEDISELDTSDEMCEVKGGLCDY